MRDLATSAQAQPPEGREMTEIHLAPVRYNRDLTLGPEPDRSERHLLMWAQKGAEFAADHEVRLAIFLSGPVRARPRLGPSTPAPRRLKNREAMCSLPNRDIWTPPPG